MSMKIRALMILVFLALVAALFPFLAQFFGRY
jgi:hypothetical protein